MLRYDNGLGVARDEAAAADLYVHCAAADATVETNIAAAMYTRHMSLSRHTRSSCTFKPPLKATVAPNSP